MMSEGMKYRHKKTGTIVETNSEIRGSNWEKVTPAAPEKPKATRRKGTTKK